MKTKLKKKKARKARAAAKRKQNWEIIGEVAVESGILMITDPKIMDQTWEVGTEPVGQPFMVLTKLGKEKYPTFKAWRFQSPFPWGSYEDFCPDLAMSIDRAVERKLVQSVDHDPVRTYSLRGASDVAQLSGERSGQLVYEEKGECDCQEKDCDGGSIEMPAAVAFPAEGGDGIYPVFAWRDRKGRIREIRITLNVRR